MQMESTDHVKWRMNLFLKTQGQATHSHIPAAVTSL
jgi:hypothetical protein